ncbi:MAG: (5-formylfuran-3-yl)methyl phosphate synthase [Methanosarcinales archaeon]|nr:(5-formylfuran-3-yl)methyl phosphate synthase [Methanosarcinales archaeon]
MRLLVSPMNIEEAGLALAGGADILDVKNPKEGSLGANFPWAIRAVAELAGGRVPVSATIGDLQYKPGTASLAALGAAYAGADYIKAGLLGIKTGEEARDMLQNIVRSVKDFDSKKKVVAAAYSDHLRVGSISPMLLPQVARDCGADVVMVDTAVKDGRSTFEFMNQQDLEEFVKAGQDLGLEVALAGTIKFADLEMISQIDPDIIGVRGVVCGGDRNTSIRRELVMQLKEAIS